MAPPGADDVRSPCPGLNSLANHGILPRDGRGYTIPILIDGLAAGMNVGADFSTVIGGGGLLASPDVLAGSFDLDQLDKHNFPIEHDASLSRADFYLDDGDNYSFNASVWNQTAGYYDGLNETDFAAAGAARFARVTTESARDARFTYTPQQFVLSYGETALYLSVLGDPVTGVAPVDWVKIFFEQERLPYNEGWRPTAAQTNLVTLAAMILELNAATGEEIPEGLIITNNTLAQAFGGLDPITGALASVVNGVTSTVSKLS